MRELTEKQLQTMSAEQITEFCRVQAKEEIRQRKQEREQAAQFEKVATPFIEQGQDFDAFMSLTGAPSSFRSRYERLQTKYQREHQPTPEQVERAKLESEVQAAMGISSDPQQQAEPTGYSGRDYFSAWAQFSQAEKDRERRRFIGGTNTASESPAEPEQPEQPESPEDNPTSLEDDPTEPDNQSNDTPSEG